MDDLQKEYEDMLLETSKDESFTYRTYAAEKLSVTLLCACREGVCIALDLLAFFLDLFVFLATSLPDFVGLVIVLARFVHSLR